MTQPRSGMLRTLDVPTRELVRLAASIAVGSEPEVGQAMVRAMATGLNPFWIDELLLQSYLFVGFPRALNAAREWRRVSGREAPAADDGVDPERMGRWRTRGEETCRIVYGDMYERLRGSIRKLHPALDDWMIVEGYGKVLSRPGLQLWRRELCIIAVCAVTDQERQLHAHLNGALNAGASLGDVEEVLAMVAERVDAERGRRMRELWERVGRAE